MFRQDAVCVKAQKGVRGHLFRESSRSRRRTQSTSRPGASNASAVRSVSVDVLTATVPVRASRCE